MRGLAARSRAGALSNLLRPRAGRTGQEGPTCLIASSDVELSIRGSWKYGTSETCGAWTMGMVVLERRPTAPTFLAVDMSRCLSVLCTGSLRCEGPVGGGRVVDGLISKNKTKKTSGTSGECAARGPRLL